MSGRVARRAGWSVAWAAFVGAAGCQVLFGVDLPDENEGGVTGAGGAAGARPMAGAGGSGTGSGGAGEACGACTQGVAACDDERRACLLATGCAAIEACAREQRCLDQPDSFSAFACVDRCSALASGSGQGVALWQAYAACAACASACGALCPAASPLCGAGGGPPMCDEGKTGCSGGCFDLLVDPTHCGSCGRACGAGVECQGGACKATELATGEAAPYALAQDDTFLYWVSPAVESDRVRRVAKAGGSLGQVFSSTVVRARSLGLEEGKLYWGDLHENPPGLLSGTPGVGGSIDSCCTAVEAGEGGVQHLALGGGKIYWSLLGSASVVRGKLLNAPADKFDPNVTDQNDPTWVAVESDILYWVARTGDGTQHEVRRLVADPPNTFEPVATNGTFFAVEPVGDRVYWAQHGPDLVVSAPKGAPLDPEQRITEFNQGRRIEGFHVQLNGGLATVFVVTFQNGALEVWRKDPSGRDPVLLGRAAVRDPDYTGNPIGASHVLADEQFVYFTDVGTITNKGALTPNSARDGVIYRVAR
ncbi:MAG TPA: hypothetical protein VFS43_29490 [Polyangiaceae bacterium]|nr:hypothetical protein [Polyangiaceae bacterium]